MTPDEMETLLRNLDARTARIEQVLPTLATKIDLEAFATKADLEGFATKADLEAFTTRADFTFATKDELRSEFRDFRVEVAGQFAEVRKEFSDRLERLDSGLRTLMEDIRGDIRLLAEHLADLMDRTRRS